MAAALPKKASTLYPERVRAEVECHARAVPEAAADAHGAGHDVELGTAIALAAEADFRHADDARTSAIGTHAAADTAEQQTGAETLAAACLTESRGGGLIDHHTPGGAGIDHGVPREASSADEDDGQAADHAERHARGT